MSSLHVKAGERKREEGSGFPHDTDTRRWEGNGWRAGLRLNMKTERPYMKDRPKDKDRERKVSLCHNRLAPCMSSDHKVLGTLMTEVRGSGEVHKDFSFRKKVTLTRQFLPGGGVTTGVGDDNVSS